MRALSGPLMMAISGLDLVYVLVFHSRQLAAIARDGFFDAVEIGPAHLDREIAFWHLAFGMTDAMVLAAHPERLGLVERRPDPRDGRARIAISIGAEYSPGWRPTWRRRQPPPGSGGRTRSR